jgi:hypothetical protein
MRIVAHLTSPAITLSRHTRRHFHPSDWQVGMSLRALSLIDHHAILLHAYYGQCGAPRIIIDIIYGFSSQGFDILDLHWNVSLRG